MATNQYHGRNTSLITILSSAHGQLRREQRDIDKRDLQRALKYGTRESAWGQRWKVEYDVGLKGASMSLGFQYKAMGMGLEMSVALMTDSVAARGIIHRRGIGKVRHLEMDHAWLQGVVAKKMLLVRKASNKYKENPCRLVQYAPSGLLHRLSLTKMFSEGGEGRCEVTPHI